ncbi:hypothetical protein S7711_10144 [Stachybotrys chartarum IBT 7711]|uniref:Heterokaryon incompatibility domain-containing protein n=1 Tax=Stachybotrys chartarum (strain CBS 109288 / IBT 7711) TaxID=1280523 RepID=A0A084AHM7_STACB|nr:hypothetical protein S7711_10144 [Stachybotrys chartarum IBT 7711]
MMTDTNEHHMKINRWNLVEDWISKCISSHPACKARQRTSGFLPTRLVHVPFGPMPVQPHYRLIEPATLPPGFLGNRYVTLSHRWGKDRNPKYVTSTANIDQRLSTGIDRQELPLTFKDAIDAAARLQISFLWIDSLCIIQGKDGDCATELTKMADIYTNSFLNTSATSASGPESGLTSSLEVHPRILRTGWNHAVGETQRVVDLAFWRERVAEAEINFRGWVFQERALAVRVLHFTFDQLAWECCEEAAAEEFPDGIPQELVSVSTRFKPTTNLFPSTKPTSSMENPPEPCEESYGIWKTLIEEYGPMELTKAADKLPAISGLTRAVQRQVGDKYLAGLWKKTLISDLLCSIPKTNRRIRGVTQAGMYDKRWDVSKRASEYRAPSWSWASVDGNIENYTHLELSGKPTSIDGGNATSRALAVILDATTVLTNPDDAFGQVSSGSLRIYGQMHRLAIDKVRLSTPTTVMRATGDFVLDCIDEPVPWSIYDEAYFLPLALLQQRFDKLPTQLTDMATLARDSAYMRLQTYRKWEVQRIERNEDERTSWAADIKRCEDHLTTLDAGEYFDRAPRLLLCPTEDRTAFKRFGFYNMSSRALRCLQKCTTADSLYLDEYAADKVFKPDEAATWGDVITGVFEIV